MWHDSRVPDMNDLDLEPGESVIFSHRMSEVHSKWATSSTAGLLVVTDKRVSFRPNAFFRLLRRQSWEIPRTSISRSTLDQVRLRVLIFGRFGVEAVHIEVDGSSPHVLVPKAGVGQQVVSAVS
jgi:hypothetical protein